MTFSELLTRVAAHSPVDWSLAESAPLLDLVDDAERDDSRGSIMAMADGLALSVSKRRSYHDQYGALEVASISASQYVEPTAGDALYRDALTTVVGVLGPPAVVGGPKARAYWRGPRRSALLTRSLVMGDACVSLVLEPTAESEAQDQRAAKWDDDWQPAWLWRARPEPCGTVDQTLHDQITYPWRPAKTLDEFDEALRDMLRSVVLDLPLLSPYITGIDWLFGADASDDYYVLCRFFSDGFDLHLDRETPARRLPMTVEAADEVAALGSRRVRDDGIAHPSELRYDARAHGEPLLTFSGMRIERVRPKRPSR